MRKGYRMKILEELEVKIVQLIQTNKDLRNRVDEFKKENEALLAQNRQFEASMLKETDAIKTLVAEKEAIKGTIEELLSSIDSIENSR